MCVCVFSGRGLQPDERVIKSASGTIKNFDFLLLRGSFFFLLLLGRENVKEIKAMAKAILLSLGNRAVVNRRRRRSIGSQDHSPSRKTITATKRTQQNVPFSSHLRYSTFTRRSPRFILLTLPEQRAG